MNESKPKIRYCNYDHICVGRCARLILYEVEKEKYNIRPINLSKARMERESVRESGEDT